MDEAKVIDCFDFDLRLADGTLYRVKCSHEDIDKLTDLIGNENIAEVEEV